MTAKRGGNGALRKDEDQDEPATRGLGKGNKPLHKSKKDLDHELDKALKDSFPASDPPAGPQPAKTELAAIPKSNPDPVAALLCLSKFRWRERS